MPLYNDFDVTFIKVRKADRKGAAMTQLFKNIARSFIRDENGTTEFLSTILMCHEDEDPEISRINRRLVDMFKNMLKDLQGLPADAQPEKICLFPPVSGTNPDLSFRLGDCLVVVENKIKRSALRKDQISRIWEGIEQEEARNDLVKRGYLVFLVPRAGIGQGEIGKIPEGRGQLLTWDDLLEGATAVLDDERKNADHPWLDWLSDGFETCRSLVHPDPGVKKERALALKDAFKEIVDRVVAQASVFAPNDELLMTTSGGMENEEERYARFSKSPGRGVYIFLDHDSDTSGDQWKIKGKRFFSINKNAKQKLGAQYELLWKMWKHLKLRKKTSSESVFPLLKKLEFSDRFAEETFELDKCSREESIDGVVNLTMEMIEQFSELMMFEQLDI